MSTSTLQQFFGRHNANWNLYANKEQRHTKVTIGFLSLILMIGATMWIAEGAFIQYSSIFSSPACSEVAKPIEESRSTRYCAGQWRVYIQGWRMSDLPEREGRPGCTNRQHQLCCSLPYHKQALGLVLCQIPYRSHPHWCSHYWTICVCTSDVGNKAI